MGQLVPADTLTATGLAMMRCSDSFIWPTSSSSAPATASAPLRPSRCSRPGPASRPPPPAWRRTRRSTAPPSWWNGQTSSSSWSAPTAPSCRGGSAHLKRARVICLDIPDDYAFMQPELVALLEKKVGPYLW